MHIGFDVSSSISAHELLPKQRGFFFNTSPVPLCSWAFNLTILAGSISDWWCNNSGNPMVRGTFTLNTTMRTCKRLLIGMMLFTSHRMLPTDMFVESMPDKVTHTWSPANTDVCGISSMVICLTEACSLIGHTSILSFGHRTPVSMRPEMQNPDPVPLNTSVTDIRNGLSMERSGVLKLSGMMWMNNDWVMIIHGLMTFGRSWSFHTDNTDESRAFVPCQEVFICWLFHQILAGQSRARNKRYVRFLESGLPQE